MKWYIPVGIFFLLLGIFFGIVISRKKKCLEECGGKCVNKSTDVNNCGVCGHKCGSNVSCVSGTC